MEDSTMSMGIVLNATPIKPAKDLLSRLTGKEKSSKKLFQSEYTEENADPNSTAQPIEVTTISEDNVARAGREESAPLDGEANAQDPFEEDVDYTAEDLLRQKQQELREREVLQEQVEHLGLKNFDLQRALEMLAKQHAKEMQLMEEENAELRKRAQKAEEKRDQVAFEAQQEKIKMQANFQTQLNQAKTQLNQAKNLANAGPGASFSTRGSFSMRILGSGRSQKLQAKVQANATERDHARHIQKLQTEVDQLNVDVWRLTRENEQWREVAAQSSTEKAELKDLVQALKEKVSFYRDIIKKLHAKNKAAKREKEDLVLKAGWAAEQLQALTAELDYERQKHVKVSRLQVVKQTEELQRLKEENEQLKKNTPVKDSKDKPTSAKKSASKSTQKKTDSGEPGVRAPQVEAPALLGTETIAELVALKARQREQRAVDLEKALKKNRESKQRREAAQAPEDPNRPVDIGNIFRNAMGNRRALMTEDSSFLSDLTNSSEEADWQ